MFSSDQERCITKASRCQANTDKGNCPACGDPAQACACGTQAGGRVFRLLMECHNEGDHSRCAYSI